MTILVRTRDELRVARDKLAGTVGLVPTMGALHRGHVANFEAAKATCDAVAVSIFVNPMQFDQAADLERYPRPLEADLGVCEQAGVDLVWAPDVDTVYAGGTSQVWITAGALAGQLEGLHRRGHFDGVLTVVAKLFLAMRPDRAFFGEKDYQQLTLIRRLVLDLDLGVDIVAVPTLREPDGLARSSRNVFLSPAERERALSLSRALRAGQGAAAQGPAAVDAAARAELGGVDVDYLELRGPGLEELPTRGSARLLVAARIGATRLIDNAGIELP